MMEVYNPPDPWLHVLYQDEHIIVVVTKPSGCYLYPASARTSRQHYVAYKSRFS